MDPALLAATQAQLDALSKLAYGAHREHVGIDPAWEALSSKEHEAWRAAVRAVLRGAKLTIDIDKTPTSPG